MYLNQTATYVPLIDKNTPTNKSGDIVRSATSQHIKVRKQPHRETRTDKNGKVYISKNIFYMRQDVIEDELLDGEIVAETYVMKSLGGHTVLRRCITR